MQEFQQRVVDEKVALEDKCTKLALFINNGEHFVRLPVSEKDRLCRQRLAMLEYLSILIERINAFE